MSENPAASDLLHLATAHLRKRVAPSLDTEARYNLLLSARAAEIAWRDRSLAEALVEAQHGVARCVAAEDVCASIRGGMTDGDIALHGALLAMTAIETYPTRPDVLSESERAEIEMLRN
jgi:hypothetical protein